MNNKTQYQCQINVNVRQLTKEELMSAYWRTTTCSPYDNTGTVRTGREWFNRYMLHPWERFGEFEIVA